MYQKLNGYYPQSPMYNTDTLTSEESDYYSSNIGRNDAALRFIIIRHAERVDITYGPGWTQHAFHSNGQYYPFDGNMPPTLPYRTNLFDYEIDTPLTNNGLKQSWNVGNTLASHNLPVVACYSSPAVRSIQTADQILNGMGRKGNIPIRIELGLFECPSWYAQTPINFMSDQELIHAGYNIDTHYKSQLKNLRSSENEYQYYERSKLTMKKLIKLHRKTGGTILIVAHAPSLEVLTRHLMNGQPRPEQLVDLAGRVGYCSMTIVDAVPSSKTWQFRYSLDEQANRQQQQIEQSNKILARSPSLSYQPIAVPSSYTIPTTTSQFPYFA